LFCHLVFSVDYFFTAGEYTAIGLKVNNTSPILWRLRNILTKGELLLPADSNRAKGLQA